MKVNEFNGIDCDPENMISEYSAEKATYYKWIDKEGNFIDYEPWFYDAKLKDIETNQNRSRSGIVPRMNIFPDKIIQIGDHNFKGLENEYKLKFTFEKT